MQLADGTEVLLDPDDEEFFGHWRWHRWHRGGGCASGYAVRKDKGGDRRKFLWLHREIVARHIGRPLRSGEIVHHDNEDPLDNRLENLRLLSHSEHSSHHASRPRGPQKQAKGVTRSRRGWRGFAQVDGRQKRGPTRSTREEALADRQRMLDGAT